MKNWCNCIGKESIIIGVAKKEKLLCTPGVL